MDRRIIGLLLLLLGLAAPIPLCWAVEVSAELSDAVSPLNRELILTVTVADAGQANPQVAEFPALPEFQMVGRSQSSSFQFINGQTNSSIAWHYTLQPQRTGKYTIPPVKVSVGRQTYETQPIQVEITDATTLPDQKNDRSLNDPFSGGRQFVTVELGKQEAYVNEPISYVFRYYATALLPTLDAPRYERPDFTGFWFKEWPIQNRRREVIDGVTYRVQEIRTTLFAQSPGTRTISAPTLHVPGLSFFDRPRVLRGEPVTVTIRPLPSIGKPDSFKGTVGEYEITAAIDRSEVQQGDAVTLTLRIAGIGHLDTLSAPDTPDLPGFTVYDPTVETDYEGSGPEPKGSRRFNYVMVSQQPGQYRVPSLPWSYFDPQAASYRTLATKPLEVTVTPASPSPNKPSLPSVAESPASDGLSPLRPDTIRLTKRGSSPYARPGFWLWQFIWLLLPLGTRLLGRHRAAIEQPLRERQRLRQALAEIDALQGVREDMRLFAAELERVLRTFLSERFSFSAGGALNEVELPSSVPPEIGTRLAQLANQLQTARFSPVALPDAGREQMLADARSLLKELGESA